MIPPAQPRDPGEDAGDRREEERSGVTERPRGAVILCGAPVEEDDHGTDEPHRDPAEDQDGKRDRYEIVEDVHDPTVRMPEKRLPRTGVPGVTIEH